VTFEWDSNKAESNEKKHGIRFEDAVRVFDDVHRLTAVDDRTDYGEVRLVTLGAVEGTTILVVVHTDRSQRTRIISARLANPKERNRYESRKNQA